MALINTGFTTKSYYTIYRVQQHTRTQSIKTAIFYIVEICSKTNRYLFFLIRSDSERQRQPSLKADYVSLIDFAIFRFGLSENRNV